MATTARRDPLAARNEQPVALASDGRTGSTKLPYTKINITGGTQMRAALNEQTASEYADELQRGAVFPPVVVFYDGSEYWLGDGFHRVRAYALAYGHTVEIPCEVRPGTRRDAVLCAAGANAVHGLRRTPEDKRRSVETLLRDEEWAQWSDREIARRCHVSHTFVSKVRTEFGGDSGNVATMEDERTFIHHKTGQPTTMNVTSQRQAAQHRQPEETPPPTGLAALEADLRARRMQQQATAEPAEPEPAPAEMTAVEALPADLVARGCKLAINGGWYFVSYGSHFDTCASLETAIAWCRKVTGTQPTPTQPAMPAKERREHLDSLYAAVNALVALGHVSGDRTAQEINRVRLELERLIGRLED